MRKELQSSKEHQSSFPPSMRTQEMSLAHETQVRMDHHVWVHHPWPWQTQARDWGSQKHIKAPPCNAGEAFQTLLTSAPPDIMVLVSS